MKFAEVYRRRLLEEITMYNKFPLSSLIIQAKKFKDYKSFSTWYSLELNHGYYWHITDNPEFKISDLSGPRDMSSMSTGNVNEPGAIMITGDLEYWDEHYNKSSNNKRTNARNYVALFDASNLDPNRLKQVGRGFGNEIYLNKQDSKKLRLIGVYDIKYAKQLNRKFHKTIPASELELKQLWDYAQHN